MKYHSFLLLLLLLLLLLDSMVIGSATVTENSRKRLWKIHQDPVNRKQEPTQLDWV